MMTFKEKEYVSLLKYRLNLEKERRVRADKTAWTLEKRLLKVEKELAKYEETP